VTPLFTRAVQAAAVALIVGVATFAMMRALPGDAAWRIAAARYGYDNLDAAAAQAVRDELGLDGPALGARMRQEADDARAIVEAAGVGLEAIESGFELDMMYQGQTHSLAVPIASSPVDEAGIRAAFEACYERTYGRLLPGIPVRIVNLRTTATGRRPTLDMESLAPDDDASMERAARDTRPIWIDGGWQEAGVLNRLDLPVGALIDGPAILEQPDTTIFLEPDLAGRVDRFGNLLIERRGAT